MKALRGATLDAGDVELVTNALKRYADNLKQYRSWLQDRDGKTLPGCESAASQVFEEMEGYYSLAYRLFRECCSDDQQSQAKDQQ